MGLLIGISWWHGWEVICLSESHSAYRHKCNFCKMTGSSCYPLQHWWIWLRTTDAFRDLQGVKMKLGKHRTGTGSGTVCTVRKKWTPINSPSEEHLLWQTRKRGCFRKGGETHPLQAFKYRCEEAVCHLLKKKNQWPTNILQSRLLKLLLWRRCRKTDKPCAVSIYLSYFKLQG